MSLAPTETANEGAAGPPPAVSEKIDPPQPPAPAPAPMPLPRAALYVMSSILLFVTQGLGMNVVTANLYQLQGTFSATITEVAWLSAAYVAPYASLSVVLFKVRAQYGLRPFAELSIICFVLASFLNLFLTDLHSAIVIRFISGMAAAPLSSLGFLYMLEAFPPNRKLTLGLSLALLNTTLAAPIARIISPTLLDLDGWKSLYTLEMGLALVALPVIYLLPLTAPPKVKVIEKTDYLAYILFASALGCLAFFFTLGRFYWWFDTWWLGVLLAVAVAFLTAMVMVELPRQNPLIDLRWIFTRENLKVGGVLLLFRFITAEQTSTASNFYQQLGLLNDQTRTLYVIILLASIVGGLFCAWLMVTRFVETAHMISLTLIAVGAFMDSQSTNLTRPEQMYLSQAMIAAGAAMFLPPVMSKGFGDALAKGLRYLVNFIAIFLFTQITGSVIATAVLGTLVTIREKFHSAALVEHVLLTNPVVAQRVSQLSASYGKVISDPTLLNAEGIVLLGQQVTREAYVLAYNDTFLLISVVAAAALAILIVNLLWCRLQASFVASKATPANPE